MRPITVTFGKGSDLASVTTVKSIPWDDLAVALTKEPPEADDKAARGWYIPATFEPAYRHGDNFVHRDAITYDFDHVGMEDWAKVLQALPDTALAMYTTYSHDVDAPRFRVVVPLSRPAGFDEFQAVSRKLAARFGIELAARESFTPPQMTFLPARPPRGVFDSYIQHGAPADVDAILGEYDVWTDRTSWPRRSAGDEVHAAADQQIAPDQKPGVVGLFCRTFRVADAIARFDLPYKPTDTPGRWTYTAGSRPEGAIEYDDGLKFHSHHDTDPARGQTNAFDLVRLHRFGALDTGGTSGANITDTPSYRAMCDFVCGLPECSSARAVDEFSALGPAPEVTEEIVTDENGNTVERFAITGAADFSSGRPMEWLVRNVLPRAELAVIYGESGSGKSFLALDLSAAISRGIEWRSRRTEKGRVVYVVAEGAGGFKARLRAYTHQHNVELHELGIISDAPNMLEPKDAALITKRIVDWGKADVVVIDTLSATTPGGDENSGQDLGLVISHCKLIHAQTGALVVIIHHSGKDASKGARGWSGLRAAADAEIEITRNGDFRTATITKMKDGGDSEAHSFKLKVVGLGENQYGEPETSCVVEHLDTAPTEAGRKVKLKGLPKLVYDTLATMAPSGTCNVDDLIEGVKKKLPSSEGARDLRRQNINTALTRSLIPAGWAFMHGEDRISLTNIVQDDTGWME